MTKKKLIEDIKQQPERFYRTPGDVLRDRRFGKDERRAILESWRRKNPAAEIDAALDELEGRGLHAAE